MSGFVRELIDRKESIDYVSAALGFPWLVSSRPVPLGNAAGLRSGSRFDSPVDYPPFSRSTRDGYALRSRDLVGASDTSPVFLRVKGEIPMGDASEATVHDGECLLVHTGGMIPGSADAVVMFEDTVQTGEWLEVRKALQSGENVIFLGEEIRKGQLLLAGGEMLDYRNVGIMATLGLCLVERMDLRVGILSTGDEIVPAETEVLPPGKVRDSNAWFLEFVLKHHGFPAKRLGIVPDSREKLAEAVHTGLEENDVLLLSGGSSVSVRDYCSEILDRLPAPGLLVRGINVSPGKPTLLAGCLPKKRLVIGLPGHPLSCSIVAITVVLPLLYRLAGVDAQPFKTARANLASDVIGRAGVEEFIPALIKDGLALPLPGKSGYVSVLREARGLIRLSENEETRRAGESVEVMEW